MGMRATATRRSVASAAAVAAAAAVVLGAGTAGCGTSGGARTSRAGAAPGPRPGLLTVTISAYEFHPLSATVAAGTRLRFVNRDQTAHTATATGPRPAFDTGTLGPGGSGTVILERPGTYTYYCQFHAFMRGTLRVIAGPRRRRPASAGRRSAGG
jgi:plastocyanin